MLSFEKRANYRKAVEAVGYYRMEMEGYKTEREMFVADISLSGIGFKPFDSRRFKLGHRLRLRFVLTYKKTVPIQCDAIVMRIIDGFIGAQFIGMEENTKKEIGFYLLP
ncbi:MAG: PilZ domain-containing protein [Acidobacteriota bacterium]